MRAHYFHLIATAILVTGCAGNNFKRLDLTEITLGVSDRQTVIKAVGNPGRDRTQTHYAGYNVTVNEVVHSFIRSDKSTGDLEYYYREQSLLFDQDILVGYTFVSGFPNESTLFDISKARLLKPGITKTDQVIDLLGPPAGERIPPVTCDDSAKEWIYKFYYNLKVKAKANHQFDYGSISRKTMLLVVRFDNDEVVTGLSTSIYC